MSHYPPILWSLLLSVQQQNMMGDHPSEWRITPATEEWHQWQSNTKCSCWCHSRWSLFWVIICCNNKELSAWVTSSVTDQWHQRQYKEKLPLTAIVWWQNTRSSLVRSALYVAHWSSHQKILMWCRTNGHFYTSLHSVSVAVTHTDSMLSSM